MIHLPIELHTPHSYQPQTMPWLGQLEYVTGESIVTMGSQETQAQARTSCCHTETYSTVPFVPKIYGTILWTCCMERFYSGFMLFYDFLVHRTKNWCTYLNMSSVCHSTFKLKRTNLVIWLPLVKEIANIVLLHYEITINNRGKLLVNL